MKSQRVSFVAVLTLFCGLITACDPPHTSPTTSKSLATTSPSPVTPPAPIENWYYTEDNDEMSGKKMYWACTSAPEGAKLCLRKKGGKLESYISFNSVSDGQFLCLEDNCGTKARFDDGPVVNFAGVEAAGGKTTILFIEPTSRLVSLIRKAKTLKLQPPVYENSSEVLHFDVAGLKW